eukprot:jgi/Hompol1/1081/HPOL_001377-RA
MNEACEDTEVALHDFSLSYCFLLLFNSRRCHAAVKERAHFEGMYAIVINSVKLVLSVPNLVQVIDHELKRLFRSPLFATETKQDVVDPIQTQFIATMFHEKRVFEHPPSIVQSTPHTVVSSAAELSGSANPLAYSGTDVLAPTFAGESTTASLSMLPTSETLHPTSLLQSQTHAMSHHLPVTSIYATTAAAPTASASNLAANSSLASNLVSSSNPSIPNILLPSALQSSLAASNHGNLSIRFANTSTNSNAMSGITSSPLSFLGAGFIAQNTATRPSSGAQRSILSSTFNSGLNRSSRPGGLGQWGNSIGQPLGSSNAHLNISSTRLNTSEHRASLDLGSSLNMRAVNESCSFDETELLEHFTRCIAHYNATLFGFRELESC